MPGFERTVRSFGVQTTRFGKYYWQLIPNSVRPVCGKAPDRELFETFEALFGNGIGL
jgi:hypothetical protein